MLLPNKIAVIYGGGGAIGRAVARAFAREGAHVCVAGRRVGPLETLAREITANGGSADAAELDATDGNAVTQHVERITRERGGVDISVNAIGVAGTDLGVPLVDLAADKFAAPIAAYTQSYFLTARAAARKMIPRKSGVIMTFSAVPARAGTPLVGGYSAAMAAKEALTRAFSSEWASHGIRVVGVRPHAIPETETMTRVFESKRASGMTWEQWQAALAARTHPRRLTTLMEVAETSAFLASDRAAGFTGTTVNLTMGHLDD
jgi:NAD(P)-dependent dehydrogenase (short-subunit alcohol dehydrogenase family)